MTKHDTWIKLKPNNPLESIIDLFPEAMIPMRDPFPLETDESGTKSLFLIDLERLSSVQANALAQVYAQNIGISSTEVAEVAAARGGFGVQGTWVESMKGGAECFARNKELVDWLESTPQPPSPQAWLQFREDQYRRWIDGNQTPPPIESIEDVDPRLRTPGLEQAMNKQKIEKMLAGYSPFDVLSGRAMVDILNKIDPDNSYSLANSDDFLEDEDIYE